MLNGKKRLLKRNIVSDDENNENDELFYLFSVPKDQKGGSINMYIREKYIINKNAYKELNIFKLLKNDGRL